MLLLTNNGTLTHYVGLSATLHAGTAIVCWHLLKHHTGWERLIGTLVSAALLLKLVLEAPPAMEPLPGAPGYVVAGYAHACGVLAGVMAAAIVDGIMSAWQRFRFRTPDE